MPYYHVSLVPLVFSKSRKALKCIVGNNRKAWIPVKGFHKDTFPDEAKDFNTPGTYQIHEWAMDTCELYTKEQAGKRSLSQSLGL